MTVKTRWLALLACLAILSTPMVVGQEGKTPKKTKFAAPADSLRFESPAKATNDLGLNVLTWDDGSFENGLGPTGGHYDGQFAMRFGGAAATSGLVPFQIRGAYFRLRAGNPGVTAVNVNFWHPLGTNGFPTNSTAPAAQVAGGTSTGVTQQVTLLGPTISTANGSVMVGVGGLGTTGWFIDRDSTGPNNNRDFAGSNSNNTLPLSYGPTTLDNVGLGGNYFVRLVVDGNVPVELESFTIE